jgi:hypothetical protein
MRRLAVVAVVLVVAVFAAAGTASATSRPPAPTLRMLKAFPVIELQRESRSRESCSAHARQAKGPVSRVDRKLAPVACEQPPRSRVRDAGSVVVLALP